MRYKYKKCQSYAAGTPQRLRNWSVASAKHITNPLGDRIVAEGVSFWQN
jgi:hypothetical protein